MDTSILQLFAADEIMSRLARRQMTGCFKVFTSVESATIFFKRGSVVAAAKGDLQGEAVLRDVLEWRDALFVWEADVLAPIPPLKPVLIKIETFLGKRADIGKTASTGISGPSGNKIIGPIEHGNGSVSSTATKSISATAENRAGHDEELLRKFKLILVAVADPTQKFALTQTNSLIGRNPGCDISIQDVSISRQHCLLQLTERGLHVKDLNTVNGTKINGIPMKEGYINIGDKLTVGHLAFVLGGTKG